MSGKHFERHDTIEVDATSEQVWEAIATGPGIDSWFLGRTEVDGKDTVRTTFGAPWPTANVTAYQQGEQFAYRQEEADGRFVAYEFLIEGKAAHSTVVRIVTSGFLPGDDWADEFESMGYGFATFYRTLREYLTHFTGRTARPVTVFGARGTDWSRAVEQIRAAMAGEPFYENPQALAYRTEGALYRFLRGLDGAVVACHAVFEPAPRDTEAGWQAWLTETVRS